MSASSLPDISTKLSARSPLRYETELGEQLGQLLKDLKIPNGAKILEVAAGNGIISAHLAGKGYKMTVTDFTEDPVKKATEHFKRNGLTGQFKVLDILEMPKETIDEQDVVFVTEILDHYDGFKVVQALKAMKKLGRHVIVLSQNPKCMPYLLYVRAAKESGDRRSGLSIFRESFANLAELAGLEVIKETYFSATALSKWMAGMISPETGELYADSVKQNLIPEDQRHFRVLAAKARTSKMSVEEQLILYKEAFETEIKALDKACQLEIQSLSKRASELDDEMVTRINSIRQLELTQDKQNKLVNTPIGLLLSLYYDRADLQRAFPEAISYDYRRLMKWAQETVNGKTGDASAKKLARFSDWFKTDENFRTAGTTVAQDKQNNPVDTPIGLLLSIYHERADLQRAFPEVAEHDYKRLLKWAQETVNGKTGDASAKKLARFSDWFNNIAKPLEEIISNEQSDPLSVVLALYLTRKDLQRAFPEVAEHDYKRLLKWAQETVNGKTGDASAKKLARFSDWFKNAPTDSEQMQGHIPSNGTISAHLELFQDLKSIQHSNK